MHLLIIEISVGETLANKNQPVLRKQHYQQENTQDLTKTRRKTSVCYPVLLLPA